MTATPLPVAVFASGSGTNLQALLDHEGAEAAYRVELVVSDRPDAGALERARAADRAAEVVAVADRPSGVVADETLTLLEEADVRAVFLAGYLRLVPERVVEAYRRRILNVHPALLPSFGGRGMYGLRIHREVLRSGVRVTGVTVHYVDEEYDTGTILAQWPVPVRSDDTAEALAARVLEVEHLLYPRAAAHLCRAIASGREAPSWHPPGEAFELREGTPREERARRIHRAFHES